LIRERKKYLAGYTYSGGEKFGKNGELETNFI
jgi:hypothetical protein